MKLVYQSEDGLQFDDPLQCASYEFTHCPGALTRFNEVIQKIHPEHRKNWCGGYEYEGGGPCGCMGCANHPVLGAGSRLVSSRS